MSQTIIPQKKKIIKYMSQTQLIGQEFQIINKRSAMLVALINTHALKWRGNKNPDKKTLFIALFLHPSQLSTLIK